MKQRHKTTILAIASLITLLLGILTVQTPVSEAVQCGLSEEFKAEALYLSRCIDGEGAHLFWGQEREVAAWIAHTYVNRSRNWLGISIEDDVVGTCYGHARSTEPPWWAYEAAVEAMVRCEDITGGTRFFLSGDDLVAMGINAAGATRSFYRGRWSLHFFKDWPG